MWAHLNRGVDQEGDREGGTKRVRGDSEADSDCIEVMAPDELVEIIVISDDDSECDHELPNVLNGNDDC